MRLLDPCREVPMRFEMRCRLVLALLCVLCSAGRPAKGADEEPVSAGKPLSAWMAQLKNANLARRLEATEAIAELGPKAQKAVPALIEALKDSDEYVRLRVSSALTQVGKPAAPALVEALKQKDTNVRRMVLYAMAIIAEQEKIDGAEKPLLGLLKDEDVIVRIFAVRALGKLKAESATGPLLDAMKKEDPFVRRSAAYALGDSGAKEAIKPLAGLLKEEDALIRRAGADSLGEIGKGLLPVLPALSEALKDRDEQV